MAQVRDILDQSREWLDDEIGADENPDDSPALWSQRQLLKYADEAQMEACLRMRLLIDSTSAFCRIPLVVNQPVYTINSSIIVARRIEFEPVAGQGRRRALNRTTYDHLDRHDRNWRDRRGCPEHIIQDLQQRTLTIVGIPTEAQEGAFLNLTVWRQPVERERLRGSGDTVAVPDEHARNLAHWVCYRAYQSPDTEKRNDALAQSHFNQFVGAFGDRPDARKLQSLSHDVNVTSDEVYF